MNFILCDYVFNFSLGLVPKMLSILSRKFGHFHPYKSNDNPSQTKVRNIHLRLKLSYLGHLNEIEIQLVNRVTSSGYYFVVRSYANSFYSVTRIRYSALSLYYRPFELISNIDPCMSLHIVQDSSNNLGC